MKEGHLKEIMKNKRKSTSIFFRWVKTFDYFFLRRINTPKPIRSAPTVIIAHFESTEGISDITATRVEHKYPVLIVL